MTTNTMKSMTKNRLPPHGFRQLLGRAPGFDMKGQGAPVELEYDESLYATLVKVQRKVNNQIEYRSDDGDYWDHDPEIKTWKGWLTGKLYMRRYGDCEDYALVKYQELVKEGVPKEALRLVLCSYKTTYHLVLAVTTKKGIFILDNRMSPVYWMERGEKFLYNWIMWSVPGQFLWESV